MLSSRSRCFRLTVCLTARSRWSPPPVRRSEVQRAQRHRCWLPPSQQHHRHRSTPTSSRPILNSDLGSHRRAPDRPVRQPRQFPRRYPTQMANFSPIVAICLDLGVVARFIPIREPWRNGVIERFNNVWDKSFFRTEVFNNPVVRGKSVWA